MVEVLHLLLGPHWWKPPVFKPCSLCEHWNHASYDQQHHHPSSPVHDRGKSKVSAMYLEDTNVLQVVSGSLTFYVFDATSQPLVGCSGGVYCLVGTTICDFFLHSIDFYQTGMLLMSNFYQKNKDRKEKCNVFLKGASLSTMVLNWREDSVILFKYWPNRWTIIMVVISSKELNLNLQRAPIAYFGRFGQILRLTAVFVLICRSSW